MTFLPRKAPRRAGKFTRESLPRPPRTHPTDASGEGGAARSRYKVLLYRLYGPAPPAFDGRAGEAAKRCTGRVITWKKRRRRQTRTPPFHHHHPRPARPYDTALLLMSLRRRPDEPV